MGLPPIKDDWFSLHDCYVYGNQNAVELLEQNLQEEESALNKLKAIASEFDVAEDADAEEARTTTSRR